MKPELLILEGVYSYKKRTEIDFSTLCSADLFGIFGSVGSGKSAVLEAITYVLYGKIERLSNRVYYNMMNLASDRMYIDFIFGSMGGRYRFTFETKRNKKDFNKIETPQRSAYRMENGEWRPLFDRDGEVAADEILGLSYDNFRRTVIVPQGKFQEFLHLEQSKRTAMLMELFNLNRFDLYSRAAGLSNRNNEKTAAVEGELSGLSDVDQQRIDEAAREADELKLKSAALNKAVDESEKRLHELKELESLNKQLASAQAALAERVSAGEAYAERRSGLRLFEECVSLFKSGIDLLAVRTREAEAGKQALDAARQRAEAGRLQLDEAEQRFAAAEKEYAEIELMRKKAGWFEELAGLQQARTDARLLKERIDSGRKDIEKAESGKKAVEDRLGGIRAELKGADSDGISPEHMENIKGLFDSIRNTAESISSGGKGLAALESDLKELNARLEAYSRLDEEEAELASREEALHARLLDAEVRKGLEQLSGQLKEGTPCPLCGSLEHPAPAAAEPVDDEQGRSEAEGLKFERAELKRRFEEYQRLNNEAAVIKGRIESSEEQLQALNKALGDFTAELPADTYSAGDSERFAADYERYKQLRNRKEVLREEADRLSEEMERLNGRISGLKEAEVRLKLELTGIEAGIDGADARIDAEMLTEYSSAPSAELIDRSAELNRRIKDVAGEYDQAVELRKSAGIRDEKNRTEVELLEGRADELEKSRRAVEDELEGAVRESDYKDLGEVKAVLGRELDTAAERAEIEAFESDLAALRNEVAGLEAKIEGRIIDPELLNSAVERNKALKEELEGVISRRGQLENITGTLKTRLIRRNELEADLEKLRVRGENLALLKNLFKAKKFINYAATIYLHELCEAANHRFRKLTRESLRLELDEANNFIIRDYLNEGKTRSVKTLSGGQTFQAAFSLSLALADSIGPERSGFFFLDEGFGSLDRESLSLVFDSLKSLKKEQRTVGVISHVEELKQEIDTFITVTRDNEEGSIIKNSWN